MKVDYWFLFACCFGMAAYGAFWCYLIYLELLA